MRTKETRKNAHSTTNKGDHADKKRETHECKKTLKSKSKNPIRNRANCTVRTPLSTKEAVTAGRNETFIKEGKIKTHPALDTSQETKSTGGFCAKTKIVSLHPDEVLTDI